MRMVYFVIVTTLLLGIPFDFINAQSAVSSNPVATTTPLTIQNLHNHIWFFTVMASSVVGWLLGMSKGFSTTSDWIARYRDLENTPTWVVWVLDLFVFVVVGAYFGTGIYNPANFVAAAAAGLSWPLGIGALTIKPDRVLTNSPQASAHNGGDNGNATN